MWLIFSDLHLHNWTYGSTVLENGINSRLQDQINVFNVLDNACKKYNISQVVFCGDLFHTPGKLDSDVVFAATVGFHKIANTTGNKPILLVGNHDFKSKDGVRNSPAFLFNTCNVVLPGMVYSQDFDNDIRAGFISFTDIPSRFNELLHQAIEQRPDFLFLHQGVKNVSVGSGFEIPNEILSSDMIPSTTLAFTGHYHRHTKVTPNLVIVGSPMQFTWGDTGDHRGYILLDENSGDWEHHPILSTPRFEKVNNYDPVKINGNFIKMEVSSNDEIPEARTKLRELKARSVEFVLPRKETTKVETAPTDLTFQGFCKSRNLDSALIKTGLDIQNNTYEVIKHTDQ